MTTVSLSVFPSAGYALYTLSLSPMPRNVICPRSVDQHQGPCHRPIFPIRSIILEKSNTVPLCHSVPRACHDPVLINLPDHQRPSYRTRPTMDSTVLLLWSGPKDAIITVVVVTAVSGLEDMAIVDPSNIDSNINVLPNQM